MCRLMIWSLDEVEAALNHPIFYLLSSAVEINISPALRIAAEVTGDE